MTPFPGRPRPIMAYGQVLWLTEAEYAWLHRTTDPVPDATPEEAAASVALHAEARRREQEDRARIERLAERLFPNMTRTEEEGR